MNSWYTIRARGAGAEVLIYDEIGTYGVSAKGFLAELGALRKRFSERGDAGSPCANHTKLQRRAIP